MTADLAERLQQKMGVYKTKSKLEGPLQISHRPKWEDLIAEGMDKRKTDKQPNATRKKVWKQLPKPKRFHPSPVNKEKKRDTVRKVD